MPKTSPQASRMRLLSRRCALVPTLLASFGVSAFTAQAQAADVSEVEKVEFFNLIEQVIRREIRVTADRSIERFGKDFAGTSDPKTKALRLLYYEAFAVQIDGSEGKINALRKELQGAFKSLSDADKALIGDIVNPDSQRQILNFVNPLYSTINPYLPPVRFTEEQKGEFEKRLSMLLGTAEAQIKAAQAAIDAFEPTFSDIQNGDGGNQKEQDKVYFEAVRLRLDLVNVFYFTHKVLREVLILKNQLGIDDSAVKAFLDTYSKQYFEKFDEWDYSLGEVNMDYRHRQLVMILECGRFHNIDMAAPEDVAGYVDDFIDPSVVQAIPKKYQGYVRTLQKTMIVDTLYWYMTLASTTEDAEKKTKFLDEAIKMWDAVADEVGKAVASRDARENQNAAKQIIVAARLFLLAGRNDEAIAVLNQITRRKEHGWVQNAKKWQQYILMGPSDGEGTGSGGGWDAPAEPMAPSDALQLMNTYRLAVQETADEAKAYEFKLKGAAALRSAVLALQSPAYADEFEKYGPEVFRMYGYMMRELGWFGHASAAVRGGMQQVHPIWVSKNNPWGNPEDEESLDKQGKMAKRLGGDHTYSISKVKKYDSSEAIKNWNSWAQEIKGDYGDNERPYVGPIIAALEEKEYDKAYKLAVGFEKEGEQDKSLEVSDTIWLYRVGKVYSMYLKMNELSKSDRKEKEVAEVSQILIADVKALKKIIDPILAVETSENTKTAKEAAGLCLMVEIFTLRKQEKWQEIMGLLGPDFWEVPPAQKKAQMDMAKQLATACYKHRFSIVKDANKRKDFSLLEKHWPTYRFAYDTFLQVREKSGSTMTGTGKTMAALLNLISGDTGKFLEGKDKGEEPYASMPRKALADIYRESTQAYVPLVMATMSDDANPLQLVKMGDDLYDAGDFPGAARIYEQYIVKAEERPDVQDYRSDSAAVVSAMQKIAMATRGSYRTFWTVQKDGDKRIAGITDLLVDAPGFIDEYRKQNGISRKLKEDKVDYGKAYVALKKFIAQVEKDKVSLGAKGKELLAALGTFKTLVTHLLSIVDKQEKLVEIYDSLGEEEKLVSLTATLMLYDPLRPRYQSAYVDSVLRGVDTASPEQVKEARMVAGSIRTASKTSDAKTYWKAVCQIIELSLYLNDMKSINQILRNHKINANNPTLDLCEDPTQEPRVARYPADAKIWKRYIEIYSKPGVAEKAPFTIETDEQGNTVAHKAGAAKKETQPQAKPAPEATVEGDK